MSHELIFGGVAICSTYGLILTEYEEVPPAPKVYTIDVPYGSNVDISDSVNGVAFYDRKHVIGLFYTWGTEQSDFEAKASEVYNALNGKRADYSLSWDTWSTTATPPVVTPYTYTGRAVVTGVRFMGFGSGLITVEITSAPYKFKEHVSESYVFDSVQVVTVKAGRKGVSPVITTDGNLFVDFGKTVMLNAGSWTIADLVVSGSKSVNLYAAGNGTEATLYDYWADELNDLKNNTLASLYTKAGTVTEQRHVTVQYDVYDL